MSGNARAISRKRWSDVSGSLRPATLTRKVQEYRGKLDREAGRLTPTLLRLVERRRERLVSQSLRFRPEMLRSETAKQRDRLENVTTRLSAAGVRQINKWQREIDARARVLGTLGYKETLKRGYAVVRSEGQVVTTAKAAKQAATLEIEFEDGRMDVGGKVGTRKSVAAPKDQGSLF